MVPLLGIPKDKSQFKFAMVSEWMANGTINQFVKVLRDANRFKLVGFLHGVLPPRSVTEIPVISAARRRHKGPDLSAHLENDPWRFEGGASSKTGTTALSLTVSMLG